MEGSTIFNCCKMVVKYFQDMLWGGGGGGL